jgi:hypothetical protein
MSDAWLRGRGRRRAVGEGDPPSRPTPPEERPPRPLVSQGARSTLPLDRPPTPDDWLRENPRRGVGTWTRLIG